VQRAFVGAWAERPPNLRLRPIVDSDAQFLCDLYASVRSAEMALVDWPEETKRQFLADQFALQHRHYEKVYVGADFLLIEVDGLPIGRIYVYRSTGEIRLMDIAVIPNRRGRGIGSALLHELMHEARASGSEITLHVEPENPAQRLYARLGFRLKEHRGVYDFLGWRAA
jgi:ribosomal protein S18 acetylase RimI-like enzyme